MCNCSLIGDLLNGVEDANFGFVAHIVAEKPGGPRGDLVRSARLVNDVRNLMLLCYTHHKLVDRDRVEDFPEERLLRIKADHERRVATLTEIRPNQASHVLRYAANIGAHQSLVNFDEIAAAMLPDRYPAEGRRTLDIALLGSSRLDDEQDFWNLEVENLRRQFSKKVTERLEGREISHLSVFALAPQPLLIVLGQLLGDLTPASVYQRHREPAGWRWAEDGTALQMEVQRYSGAGRRVALAIALSATFNVDRIRSVLGNDTDIWLLQADNPHNDIMRRSADLAAFRQVVRQTFDQIKAMYPDVAEIHLFPAMPVSCSIEVGRVWMPKADLPLVLYDENRKLGGFQRALRIENK